MNYSRALILCREARRWTQKETGKHCGLHASQISFIEQGQRKPRADTLEALCKGLGVPQYLFMLLGHEQSDPQTGVPFEQIEPFAKELLKLVVEKS